MRQLETETSLYSEVRIPMPWGHVAGRWYGDQMRRPILALHGWLDNCGTFAKLAPLLLQHAGLLCIDLPGQGLSTHLPVGMLYDNLEYVRVILRLMEAYKWDKVSLLGHSMGGSVAFHFASFYPDRVDMVIGIDILKSVFVEEALIPTYVHHMMERALIENERLINISDMNEPPSYTFAECEQLLYEGSNKSIDLDKCKYILERNISKSLKFPDKYYFSRDGRVKTIGDFNPNRNVTMVMGKRICRARLPYMVLKAGDSRNVGEAMTDLISLFRERNPNFEMHELEGMRHHLHLNNPEPVAELILSFLEKHSDVVLIEKQPAKL